MTDDWPPLEWTDRGQDVWRVDESTISVTGNAPVDLRDIEQIDDGLAATIGWSRTYSLVLRPVNDRPLRLSFTSRDGSQRRMNFLRFRRELLRRYAVVRPDGRVNPAGPRVERLVNRVVGACSVAMSMYAVIVRGSSLGWVLGVPVGLAGWWFLYNGLKRTVRADDYAIAVLDSKNLQRVPDFVVALLVSALIAVVALVTALLT